MEQKQAGLNTREMPGRPRHEGWGSWRLDAFPYPELLEGTAALEVEIGCGKARFLIARAQAHPDIRFLAIDRVAKWMGVGEKRAGRRGLDNLHFLKADAREVIRHHLPDERVSAFHIYFPDPWPKRRHHARRIVEPGLLKLLERKLVKPSGRIFLATDDEPYYCFMKEAIRESGIAFRVRETVNTPIHGEDTTRTNYELKWLAEGRTLYYLELYRS